MPLQSLQQVNNLKERALQKGNANPPALWPGRKRPRLKRASGPQMARVHQSSPAALMLLSKRAHHEIQLPRNICGVLIVHLLPDLDLELERCKCSRRKCVLATVGF